MSFMVRPKTYVKPLVYIYIYIDGQESFRNSLGEQSYRRQSDLQKKPLP
jgi:hypothetical protein